MGASNSKSEVDKGVQLCRERKKFIKQALNGRCSLAAAHIAYVDELRIIGTALRKFVEADAPVERQPSIYPSRSVTPERLALTEKTLSQTFSSPSLSQRIDPPGHISPSPSPPTSTGFQTHHMKFRGPFSREVEEKPPVAVTVSVESSTPPNTTPRSTEGPESSLFDTPSIPAETPPWDYFGLFHDIDNHFSSQEGKGIDQSSAYTDEIRQLKEEDGGPELEDTEEKFSTSGREESQESEDEFDEPSAAILVRSFENVNRTTENVVSGDASTTPSSQYVASEAKLMNGKKSNSPNLSPLRASPSRNADAPTTPSPQDVASEAKLVNGKKSNSPNLSPLKTSASRFVLTDDVKIVPMKESEVEDKVVPKDFFSSMKDIERLFIKASESGREVPKMLEANKFHFRPVSAGKESGSVTSVLLKSCFSCGDDPSEVQEEPPESSVKYLTWHRTTSSLSSSSRNPLGANSTDDVDDLTNNLFDNFCMVSGSHASTLDRLYAWEKKLYDEVKASVALKREFDQRCKYLRQLESQEASTNKIYKTRATLKDLHSRIRVSIHRIDSISKNIEEIRDKELQPQLEELIEGLRKMWEMILECHRLQLHIISISSTPGNTRITLQSDTRRQVTIHLEHELSSLLSTFKKWIGAQKIYVESIDKWLFKCVSLQQKPSKRNKRAKPPGIRECGPPIFVICGVWLQLIDGLPSKDVEEAIKDLADEINHFLPRQEKNQDKGTLFSRPIWQAGNTNDAGYTNLGDEAPEDFIPAFDRFKTSLTGFLSRLNNFAEASLNMFTQLQNAKEEAKVSSEQFKSQT